MAWKVKVVGNDWKEYLRQPCEVYTRVMWYLRPVNNFNIGKKTEFYSRKYFNEDKTCPRNFDRQSANSIFTEKYS